MVVYIYFLEIIQALSSVFLEVVSTSAVQVPSEDANEDSSLADLTLLLLGLILPELNPD